MSDLVERLRAGTYYGTWDLMNEAAAEIERLRKDAERLQFLEDEANAGMAPNLVFDDDGHWCVTYDGMQPMPEGDGKGYSVTVGIHCIVHPEDWRSSVRAAIDAAMQAKEGA